jgi:queuine tRNA-ribosyltransferase
MPVATQASLKGLTPEQLEDTGCRLCLNNTYHLGLKPGQAVLDAIGGAHKLQGWNYNILTDSGGLVALTWFRAQNLHTDLCEAFRWSRC